MTDGIERVISKAAADSRFRQRLLSDREAALGRCRVPLTDSERAILAAIPDAQLAATIDSAMPQRTARRGFLGKMAAAMGALLGAGALLGGCSGPTDDPEPIPDPVRGSRPD